MGDTPFLGGRGGGGGCSNENYLKFPVRTDRKSDDLVEFYFPTCIQAVPFGA